MKYLQEREKKTSKLEESGLTTEELWEQQKALFEKSRAAFDAKSGATTSGAAGEPSSP